MPGLLEVNLCQLPEMRVQMVVDVDNIITDEVGQHLRWDNL